MIRRITEYIVSCDGPNCCESVAYCSPTREHCRDAAIKDGWYSTTRTTLGRWLCQHCKAQAEKLAADANKEPSHV